jgi:DNA processing protein
MRALARGEDGALRDWVANESATRLAEARRDARLAMARLDRLGARVIGLLDDEYPAGLRDLKDPPAFLTVRGTFSAAGPVGTAIVGSREASPEGVAFARAFAGLAAAPIVSGLALGIDAAAHEGALAARVATLAYVGNGLGATYPPEHAELEERIVAGGGAVLSELLPGEAVTRGSLVRRDRLQAAHSVAVVMVESEPAGGAMHTLAAARKLGRPTFVLDPREGPGFGGNRAARDEGSTVLPWDPQDALRALAEAGAK